MFVVRCSLLVVVCCLLILDCCLLPVVCNVLCGVCCLLDVACCLSCLLLVLCCFGNVVREVLLACVVGCGSLFDVGCSLCLVRCWLLVVDC